MKEYSRVSALQGAPAPDAEIFVDYFPLEERILFDGAAAAEAADYVNDISGEQAIADEAAAQQADEQAAEALALAMAEIPGEQGNEIYFVDAGIGNSDALISAIPQGAEVVLIDAGSDGVDQIKSVLEGRSGIDAIHILSHGDPGEINLGNARLEAGVGIDETAHFLGVAGEDHHQPLAMVLHVLEQRVDRHHRLDRARIIREARPRCLTADNLNHAEGIIVDIGTLTERIRQRSGAARQTLRRFARITIGHRAVEIAAGALEVLSLPRN